MAEPVSLAQAKAHLRVIDTNEDALITLLIVAAREFVENRTGRILVQRAMTERRDCFGGYLQLYWRPVVAVTTISYTDSAGAAAAYTGFRSNIGPARVYPALNGSWPSLGSNGEVIVTYTAGYAVGQEPQSLIQAMLLLIGHWFGIRETVVIGAGASEVPFAVGALCDQHQVVVG